MHRSTREWKVMKSAVTQSTWSEFRVVVIPGAVISIWITDQQMRVDICESYVNLPRENLDMLRSVDSQFIKTSYSSTSISI
jgi:hypothetical protein